MGRKRKYFTEEEQQDAQRRWQMEHYERNKEKILRKARDRYRQRKLKETREKNRKELYGE